MSWYLFNSGLYMLIRQRITLSQLSKWKKQKKFAKCFYLFKWTKAVQKKIINNLKACSVYF